MSKSIQIKIHTPLEQGLLEALHAGDRALLSGTVYTARDAAHKRMCETLAAGGKLPFEAEGQVIFYAGPAPAPPGGIIGSIGPTTSYRMDAYTPTLLEQGIKAMIGKGIRSEAVKAACLKHRAVYFAAAGGVAALLAGCVIKSQIIAYEDLGAEAIRRLEIRDMPLWVALDCHGGDIYAHIQAEN